ncbi:MAG: hypothetical protein AB8B95_02030 [Pseudohongiellaceae bacterium]
MTSIDSQTFLQHLYFRKSRSFSALVLTLILATPSVFAQHLSASAFTPNVTSGELAATWSQLSDQPPAKVIAQLKEELGAYDVRLPEILRVFGRQYQEAGDHASALELLSNSWQLSRINEGFYSSSQIATLELIIYSDTELGNWSDVDNHYAYLELLHRRAFDDNDPRLEIGLQKVSAWHVNALSLRVGSKERIHHLRSAYHLFKDRLAIAEKNLDATDPKFGYLRESIKLTEAQLRFNSNRDKAAILQQQVVGIGSLIADNY